MPQLFIQPTWPAPKNIRALVSLKASGVSRMVSHENEARVDVSKIMSAFNLPSEPIWLQQIHSNIAVEAIADLVKTAADASYSTTAGQVCAILTADCLPILLCTENGKQVAAIHAGWKGLANGIIENTLAKMQSPSEKVLAWLGPAIGPDHFVVRAEVYDAFTKDDPSHKSAFKPFADNHWHANLYELARQKLQKQGINQIFAKECCTYCDEERFFSYRRDGKLTGRILSFIWIEDSCSNL